MIYKQNNNPEEDSNSQDKDFLTDSFDVSASNVWKEQSIKKEKRLKFKKSLLIIFITVCVIIALVIGSFSALNIIGKNKLLNNNVNIEANNNEAIVYGDSTILYNEILYEYNPNITGILFMGIEREELVETNSFGTNGQADTLMLVTVDTQTGKTVFTAIPRDTMTGIDLYSSGGEFLKKETEQICLAYAYGDGKTLSCENTVKAVCELFHGMPINTYLATDYSLVSQLTDIFGGITVVPNETFSSALSSYRTEYHFEKDVPTDLNKKNVLTYLKYRGNNVDSSYLRMERQMNYITNMVQKATELTKRDIRFPISLYNMFSKQTVSNLSPDKITYVTSAIFNSRNDIRSEFKKIEGQQIIGESGYAEFYPDETKLFELVLELFYLPVS